MTTLYMLCSVSPKEIEERGEFNWSLSRHSSDKEWLESLMQNWDDAGNTVYLYELTADMADSILVLMLDEDFSWEDYVSFFNIKLIKQEVVQ